MTPPILRHRGARTLLAGILLSSIGAAAVAMLDGPAPVRACAIGAGSGHG